MANGKDDSPPGWHNELIFLVMIIAGCIGHEMGADQPLLTMLQRALGLFLAFEGAVLLISSVIKKGAHCSKGPA